MAGDKSFQVVYYWYSDTPAKHEQFPESQWTHTAAKLIGSTKQDYEFRNL